MENSKNDPKGPVGILWKQIQPYLELVGGNVMYGELKTSQTLTKTCEITKRYGCGCIFAKLSHADPYKSEVLELQFELTQISHSQ